MAEVEPQYASDYDDRTTVAVKSVLVEIGQILGSYRGKFAVIGGAVPWLLLGEADMPHIGTLDVDLSLDAEALGDGEYAQLVESLLRQGYHRREHLPRFQLVRTVSARDDGADIDVLVDFLMPRDATIARNAPPLVANFAVQRADGADLALKFYQLVAIDGDMPDGGGNRVQIAVASIPALLAMPSRIGASKRMPTISTTASETFRTASTRSPWQRGRSSNSRRRGRVISISRRSFATWTISGRPACGSSSTGPTCSESAPRINGSRTHSGRWTLGSRR